MCSYFPPHSLCYPTINLLLAFLSQLSKIMRYFWSSKILLTMQADKVLQSILSLIKSSESSLCHFRFIPGIQRCFICFLVEWIKQDSVLNSSLSDFIQFVFFWIAPDFKIKFSLDNIKIFLDPIQFTGCFSCMTGIFHHLDRLLEPLNFQGFTINFYVFFVVHVI